MRPLDWVGVTGMGRSGTTFLGAALALPRRVGYLHEPFNPTCGIRGIDWNDPQLLDEELKPSPRVAESIERILRLRGRLTNYAPSRDNLLRRTAKRLVGGRGPVELVKARLTPGLTHAVLKDPVGFYLFPHLQAKHGVHNLVVVKHPVAAVAGHARVGWLDGIAFIKEKPYLKPHLTDHELAGLNLEYNSPAELIAWQWRITYGFLLRQARQHGWRVAVIEEVSESPVEAIRELYQHFGLPWSDSCQKRLLKQTGTSNLPDARGNRVQDLNRDSRQVFAKQRERVSPEDRRRVFEITWDLAQEVYDETSFKLA